MSTDQFLQLFEMPVTGIHHVGNFDQAVSFKHPEDRKLVTHPRLVQRIQNAFAKVGPDIELYFVNTPEARRYLELGQVSSEFVFTKRNPAQKAGYSSPAGEGLGLSPEDVQIQPDTITIFFTNNRGTERFPMTPWIIGHRFGHALWASRYNKRNAYYEKFGKLVVNGLNTIAAAYGGLAKPVWNSYGGYSNVTGDRNARKAVAHVIGTMRSARTRNLRDDGEFIHELFAQFLTTGRITLNPLPMAVPYRFAWGNPIYAYLKKDSPQHVAAEQMRGIMLTELPSLAATTLGSIVGNIYVM